MYRFEELELETEIIGKRAVKYPCDETGIVDDVDGVVREMLQDSIEFTHVRVSSDEQATIERFCAAGFVDVGELWTFELTLINREQQLRKLGQSSVEPLHHAFELQLAELARTSFSQDRFHRDPRIPEQAANHLKSRWALNNLNGRAEYNWGYIEEGLLQGFIQCLVRGTTLAIDLVAVSEASRGKGIGQTLVNEVIVSAKSSGFDRVIVGTQADNQSSQALYRKFGFERIKCGRSLHWHASKTSKHLG